MEAGRMTPQHIASLDGSPQQSHDGEAIKTPMAGTPTVFFDGSCPICRREISFYRRQRGAEYLSWIDVSQNPDGEIISGLSRERAVSRFHVLEENGALRSGGQAFAALWLHLPGFKWLGRLFRLPVLAWMLERSYRLFLKYRPKLQRLFDKNPR